jgi:hypothetical protein
VRDDRCTQPCPAFYWLRWGVSQELFCPGWPQTEILQISASHRLQPWATALSLAFWSLARIYNWSTGDKGEIVTWLNWDNRAWQGLG